MLSSMEPETTRVERLCALEPRPLIEAFLHNPPFGFSVPDMEAKTPSFVAPFSVLTTLDEDIRRKVPRNALFRWLESNLLTFRTLFAGTTVSEYAIFSDDTVPAEIPQDMLAAMRENRCSLAIIKDIPNASPLLSAAENAAAQNLASACRKAGFTIMEGQALAFVPVDYASADDFLKRVSHSRRKDIRRKLRSRSELSIEEISTGDPRLSEKNTRAELYSLYEQVFVQSEIHFDKLTPQFFDTVLTDSTNGGKLILYRHQNSLIGFNLCFTHNGNLIDKYIGLKYPEARDLNLYFVSWIYNLELALRLGCKFYVAGWTDPVIKKYLGATFTFTQHAVYFRNPLFRAALHLLRPFFEADSNALSEEPKESAGT